MAVPSCHPQMQLCMSSCGGCGHVETRNQCLCQQAVAWSVQMYPTISSYSLHSQMHLSSCRLSCTRHLEQKGCLVAAGELSLYTFWDCCQRLMRKNMKCTMVPKAVSRQQLDAVQDMATCLPSAALQLPGCRSVYPPNHTHRATLPPCSAS